MTPLARKSQSCLAPLCRLRSSGLLARQRLGLLAEQPQSWKWCQGARKSRFFGLLLTDCSCFAINALQIGIKLNSLIDDGKRLACLNIRRVSGNPYVLICRPRLGAVAHDVLGLLVVNFRECVVCLTVRMEQLVELRLECLGMAVFSALYE